MRSYNLRNEALTRSSRAEQVECLSSTLSADSLPSPRVRIFIGTHTPHPRDVLNGHTPSAESGRVRTVAAGPGGRRFDRHPRFAGSPLQITPPFPHGQQSDANSIRGNNTMPSEGFFCTQSLAELAPGPTDLSLLIERGSGQLIGHLSTIVGPTVASAYYPAVTACNRAGIIDEVGHQLARGT